MSVLVTGAHGGVGASLRDGIRQTIERFEWLRRAGRLDARELTRPDP